MSLSVLYQNVRGLRTKLNEFKQNLNVNHPDIVFITESWLNDNIFDHEIIDLNQYSIFRRDRQTTGCKKLDGGGVLIAVKNKFCAYPLPQFQSDAEDIWVAIRLDGNRLLYVCCVYLPPGDIEAHVSFSSQLDSSGSNLDNKELLILGDFNLSSIQWVNVNQNNYLDPYNVESKYSQLIDNLSILNCMQFNTVLNQKNKLLDLIFCNSTNISEVNHCSSSLVQEDVHHPTIEFLYSFDDFRGLKNNNNKYLNFKKANYTLINQEISSIDWINAFNHGSLNTNLSIFYDNIWKIINSYVPTYLKNKYYPVYYSDHTIKVIKEKNKLHKKWRIYKNQNDYNLFKVLRSNSKKLVDKDFKNYIRYIEDNINSNPSKFWSYSSLKKQNFIKIPTEVHWEDQVAKCGRDICNLFGCYFKSVFEPERFPLNNVTLSQSKYATSLCNIQLQENDVLKALQALDTKKGPGPDKLPPHFIKMCATSLSSPLTLLFNISLRLGEFPDLWKSSTVVPISKGGQKNLVKNYRPITKLSIIPKTFEKLIYNYLFSHVKNIIIQEQHGFFSGRSLETNLFLYSEFLYANLDDRIQVDAVYTDFSKAFDKVSHNILLARLAEVGVGGSLLRWVESYIKNRTLHVSVQGFLSDSFEPSSGVPQGSHLGPLFFIIYINKIKECFLHCNFLLYADDLKIFRKIRNISDCYLLQNDLDRVSYFCNQNGLFFNLDKCLTITFTRNINKIIFNYNITQHSLNKFGNVKDLGLIFDSKLIFDIHIESVINSSLRMLGYVKRKCKLFHSGKVILSLYNAFVLSKLSFASIIWNPQYATYIERLERVQNKFLKFLAYKSNFITEDGVSLARNHFRIVTLENRRKISDILFLHKILNNCIDSSEILSMIGFSIPSRDLRNNSIFHVPFRNTNCSQNSPLLRMLRCGNMYGTYYDIFCINRCKLKTNLKAIVI